MGQQEPVFLDLTAETPNENFDPRAVLLHIGPKRPDGNYPLLVYYPEGNCLASVMFGFMGQTCYNWIADAPVFYHAERCLVRVPTRSEACEHFLSEVVPAVEKLVLTPEAAECFAAWRKAAKRGRARHAPDATAERDALRQKVADLQMQVAGLRVMQEQADDEIDELRNAMPRWVQRDKGAYEPWLLVFSTHRHAASIASVQFVGIVGEICTDPEWTWSDGRDSERFHTRDEAMRNAEGSFGLPECEVVA